jgi:hypothetical protein
MALVSLVIGGWLSFAARQWRSSWPTAQMILPTSSLSTESSKAATTACSDRDSFAGGLSSIYPKLKLRSATAGVQPLLSHHFNLTVELPLKCIIRGYRYAVLPNSWKGRKQGASKLLTKEMGSRYLFIILYCWLEQALSRGDYRDHKYRENQLQVWPR